jgi:DegV family protein with EDD domain
MSFSIFTDSSANLTKETLAALDIQVVSLTYTVNGEEYLCYDPDIAFDGDAFYSALRDPDFRVRTSLINSERFKAAFEPELSAGNDVLYLAMSSQISGTYQAALAASEELGPVYPERKITVLDTRAASRGEGRMVCRAAMMREDGKTTEQIAAWVEEAKKSVRQHFLVDDLQFLSRGGRISGAAAFVGSMLQIKPLMKGADGKIVLDCKVPGRKAALRMLADIFDQTVLDPSSQTIGIAHAGCEADALTLRDIIASRHHIEDFMIVCYEPGTGAHGGPGAVALFFYGQEKKTDSLPAALLHRLDLDSGRLREFVSDKLKLLKGKK